MVLVLSKGEGGTKGWRTRVSVTVDEKIEGLVSERLNMWGTEVFVERGSDDSIY